MAHWHKLAKKILLHKLCSTGPQVQNIENFKIQAKEEIGNIWINERGFL